MSGPLELRPEVAAFAQAMERKLRANDHKGGWQLMKPTQLLTRLREETAELRDALDESDPFYSRGILLEEAADVANFAMMIADVRGALTDF